jgi:hypothetical protein
MSTMKAEKIVVSFWVIGAETRYRYQLKAQREEIEM